MKLYILKKSGFPHLFWLWTKQIAVQCIEYDPIYVKYKPQSPKSNNQYKSLANNLEWLVSMSVNCNSVFQFLRRKFLEISCLILFSIYSVNIFIGSTFNLTLKELKIPWLSCFWGIQVCHSSPYSNTMNFFQFLKISYLPYF